MFKYKISSCIIYFILIKVSTCYGYDIGSIDLIFSKISLPSNLELTIFSDSNSRGPLEQDDSDDDDVREIIFRKLNTRTTRSFLNPNIFQTNFLQLKKIRDENVQLLYIFKHQNFTSFFNTLDQISILCDDQQKSIETGDRNFWNSMYILIWPSTCQQEQDKVEENLHEEHLIKYTKKFNLRDDIYILNIPCGKDEIVSDISIWEFYSITNKSIFHKFNFKIGTPDNPWHILGNKISRRKNFEGAHITATAPNDLSYEQESKFLENSTSKFESGTSVERYWFLRDGLNFKESGVQDMWTSEDESGELTGGALKVMNGEVDISISQTAMTQNKQKYIDFLQPTDVSILKAFFIQPPVSKYRDIFISPFQKELWIAMFSTWLLITFCLKTFSWIQHHNDDLNDNDNQIVTDSWIWAIGTACQQGWHIQPVSLSIRIIFALGHLTGLVCFAAYSASIVSFLSLKAAPMKTFSDILDNSFRIFTNENSTPIAYILPELKMQPNFPSKVLLPEFISIPMIMNSKSTVITYTDVFSVEAKLLNYTDQLLCDKISSVQINFVDLSSGMIVKKGSPFTEYFNYQIMVMLEGGLNSRYLSMYNTGTETSCLQFTTGYKQALGLHDVLTAWLVLFIGYVISLVIFILEIIVTTRQKLLYPLIM